MLAARSLNAHGYTHQAMVYADRDIRTHNNTGDCDPYAPDAGTLFQVFSWKHQILIEALDSFMDSAVTDALDTIADKLAQEGGWDPAEHPVQVAMQAFWSSLISRLVPFRPLWTSAVLNPDGTVIFAPLVAIELRRKFHDHMGQLFPQLVIPPAIWIWPLPPSEDGTYAKQVARERPYLRDPHGKPGAEPARHDKEDLKLTALFLGLFLDHPLPNEALDDILMAATAATTAYWFFDIMPSDSAVDLVTDDMAAILAPLLGRQFTMNPKREFVIRPDTSQLARGLRLDKRFRTDTIAKVAEQFFSLVEANQLPINRPLEWLYGQLPKALDPTKAL